MKAAVTPAPKQKSQASKVTTPIHFSVFPTKNEQRFPEKVDAVFLLDSGL